MKVYIVGAEITKYSWDNCVDRWDEVPRLLGVYTDRAAAEEIAEQFDGTVTEVETDKIINDNSYYDCNFEGVCSQSECYHCEYSKLNAGESGISII